MVGVSLRAFLDAHTTVMVVLLLLIAAAAAGVAYDANTAEETEDEQRTLGTWGVDGAFHHGADVRRDTSVFDAGERIENRTLYFTSISPELDGRYVLSHGGSAAEPAMATVDLTLVIRAVEYESDGAPTVHWKETRSIATTDAGDLGADDAFPVEFAVNVTAIQEQIEAIETELGASPGATEVLVRADATVETIAHGERLQETRTDRLEIAPGTATYTVDERVDEPVSRDVRETVTVPVTPSPIVRYGSILVAVLSGVVAVTLGLLGRRGVLTVNEAEWARYEQRGARSDFDTWISSGSVPADPDRPTVRVDTLEDLVNVAIDSDRRVIETDGGRYVVLVDGVAYEFETR